jgi:hypothetical protein
MKTKPQLRARRMWANYYADGTCRIHSTKKNAWSWRCFTEDKSSVPAAIPVVVIPLDDVEALQSTAYNAYYGAQDANRDSMECVVAALTAIGVLPSQRKGGAK